MRAKEEHEKRIVEQFNAQAASFGRIPAHLAGMETLAELCGIGRDDAAVDLACGPGLLSCAFAKDARSATGCDLAPAMLEKARERAREMKLENASFVEADACATPFPDESFDIAATRYSLHHMLEPARLLSEMKRLCRKGGRVLAADVCIDERRVALYDELELLRDSSHVHALTPLEFEGVFAAQGFAGVRRASFRIEIELEAQIAASRFGDEAGVEKFRRTITKEGANAGVEVREEGGKVFYSCPVLALCGVKE